jgi:hypothetical protein
VRYRIVNWRGEGRCSIYPQHGVNLPFSQDTGQCSTVEMVAWGSSLNLLWALRQVAHPLCLTNLETRDSNGPTSQEPMSEVCLDTTHMERQLTLTWPILHRLDDHGRQSPASCNVQPGETKFILHPGGDPCRQK